MTRQRWTVLATVLVVGLTAFWLVKLRQRDRVMVAPISAGMQALEVRHVFGAPAKIEHKGHFAIGGEASGRCRDVPAEERWVYGESSFYRLIYFDSAGKVLCDEWLIIHV